MRHIWKVIIALLIGNMIGNLTYKRLDYFQYNRDLGVFTLENIIKFILNLGLSVAIPFALYLLLDRLFPRPRDK